MLPSDIQAQSLTNTTRLFLRFWEVEYERAGIASSTVAYLAASCPILAKDDSSAIKTEFHLFPAFLSRSFSDTIHNEQFVSIWLSRVQNQDIPGSPHSIRDAVVCQLLPACPGKFLQRLEQALRDRSDLFWGVLKDAKNLWAQGSPKTPWYNSAVHFKIQASELWSSWFAAPTGHADTFLRERTP